MAAAHTFSAAFSSNLFSFHSFLSILTQVNLTYAQVTASLSIDFVSSVKIHLPTFLNVSTPSFLSKYGFLTLPLACSDTNPYVLNRTLQRKRGKRNQIYCLHKRTDPLHAVWEHYPKTSKGTTAAAEHTSYNSAFNETTVISCTEITVGLIITGRVKTQLPPFPPTSL